jgi:peptide/nickel transport system permease protein
VGRFLVRRLLQSALLLFAVMTASFFLVHLAPGGPEAALISNPKSTPESVERARKAWELDAPLPERYARWLRNLATLDSLPAAAGG